MRARHAGTGPAWLLVECFPCCLVRYRRDARALDDDEEMWFNEDEDDDEGEPVVEKSRSEEDFPESYGKFIQAKKGILLPFSAAYCSGKNPLSVAYCNG